MRGCNGNIIRRKRKMELNAKEGWEEGG